MAVYYVAKAGNDSNAGTAHGSPKLTITSAVGSAYGSAGNVVEIIDSGIYAEGDIEIYSNPITVRATGSNRPIMDGDTNNENYAFVTYISGCVFQGLSMRQYDDGIINGFNAAGRDFRLRDCVGHIVGGPQNIGGGGISEIHQCKIVSDGNAAFSVVSDSTVWFNNSVIASNKPGYPALKSATTYTNVTASFCTFIGSGHDNSTARNWHLVDQVYKVINCIVTGSGDGINASDSTYNVVHVGGDPFITWTSDHYDGTARSAATGEVTGNPLFVSGSSSGIVDSDSGTSGNQEVLGDVDFGTQNYSGSQDYSLSSDSGPADGAGVAYNNITTDITGAARSDPPTIGAYAFAAAGYANTIITVAAGSLGKVLGVATADISKVIGT
jgi:hypothetical protein